MSAPKFALVILGYKPGATSLATPIINITNALDLAGNTTKLSNNAWLLPLPEFWHTLCALVAAAKDAQLQHHVALLEEDPFMKIS